MARKQEPKKAPVPHKVFTERGLRLEKAHKAQHNSNINHDQPVLIDYRDERESTFVKIGQKCPKCGKRVRGPNHSKGDHHRGTVKRCVR